MDGTPREKPADRAAILRRYKKVCLIIGTFGFGGFMAVMMFTSVRHVEEIRLPWQVLLAIVTIINLLGGTIWGWLFYLITRNSLIKRHGL